jgi:hypothetical protein
LALQTGVPVGISLGLHGTLSGADQEKRRVEAGMGNMRKLWAAVFLALGAGCQNFPPLMEGPTLVPAGSNIIYDQNPVFIPLGPDSYGQVFENCLRVLEEYGFEIRDQDTTRYFGQIECMPRVCPGLGLFLKPGSPDLWDRLLATTQSYRHRVSIMIQPADNGGFFIHVTARKELEDVPRPVRSTVGAAVFRNEPTVERQFEVVDPVFFESNWIPRGRDVPLEQEIIRRLKKCM